MNAGVEYGSSLATRVMAFERGRRQLHSKMLP